MRTEEEEGRRGGREEEGERRVQGERRREDGEGKRERHAMEGRKEAGERGDKGRDGSQGNMRKGKAGAGWRTEEATSCGKREGTKEGDREGGSGRVCGARRSKCVCVRAAPFALRRGESPEQISFEQSCQIHVVALDLVLTRPHVGRAGVTPQRRLAKRPLARHPWQDRGGALGGESPR